MIPFAHALQWNSILLQHTQSKLQNLCMTCGVHHRDASATAGVHIFFGYLPRGCCLARMRRRYVVPLCTEGPLLWLCYAYQYGRLLDGMMMTCIPPIGRDVYQHIGSSSREREIEKNSGTCCWHGIDNALFGRKEDEDSEVGCKAN